MDKKDLVMQMMEDFEGKEINMKATDFILITLGYSAQCFNNNDKTVLEQLEFIADVGNLLGVATNPRKAKKIIERSKRAYSRAAENTKNFDEEEIKKQLKIIRDTLSKVVEE